jgi:hypothetical protein
LTPGTTKRGKLIWGIVLAAFLLWGLLVGSALLMSFDSRVRLVTRLIAIPFALFACYLAFWIFALQVIWLRYLISLVIPERWKARLR